MGKKTREGDKRRGDTWRGDTWQNVAHWTRDVACDPCHLSVMPAGVKRLKTKMKTKDQDQDYKRPK